MSIDTTMSKPHSHSTIRESMTRQSLFDGSLSQNPVSPNSNRHLFSLMDSTKIQQRSSFESPSLSAPQQ